MRAVILAAGRGSRMGSLTDAVPKCLVPLAGRPLLEWQREALNGAGVTEIGVVRGYRPHLLDGRGLATFDNARWAETNMVASLACARAWLTEGPVIVSYSDIFYPASAVQALIAAEGDIAVTYDPQWLGLWSQRFADPLSDAETFRIENGRITEIGRRAERLEDIEGQYMGLLKFTPAGWAAVESHLDPLPPPRRDRLDMTGLLSQLIGAGLPVHGVAVSGRWGEVDNAGDLALYERWLADGDGTGWTTR